MILFFISLLIVALGGLAYVSQVLSSLVVAGFVVAGFMVAGFVVAIVIKSSISKRQEAKAALLKAKAAPLISVQFAPNGRIVTVSKSNMVRVIASETGLVINTFRRGPEWISDVAYSADGRYVVWAESGSRDPEIGISFGESLSPQQMHPSEPMIHEFGDDDDPFPPLINRDGSVFGFLLSDQPFLWDAKSGEALEWKGGSTGGLRSAAFGTDSRHLAIWIDGAVVVYDIRSGEVVRAFEGGGRIVFSPDGHYMAIRDAALIRIWNYAAGTLAQTLELGSTVGTIAFSPDHRRLVCDVNGASLWDVEQGVCLWNRHPGNGRIECFSFSSDGRQVLGLVDGGHVYRWSLADDGHLVSTEILSNKEWVGEVS